MPNLGQGANVSWVLYDSILGDAAAVRATLFTVPIGGAGKTKYETNMRLAGQLSADTQFNIQALACGCLPTTPKASLQSFLDGYFELYVGGEIWYEAPIFTVPAGYGFKVAYEQANAGLADVSQNGMPRADNLLTLDRDIEIKAHEEIRVDFVWQAAVAEVNFWFFLYGEYIKPLQ